MSRPEPHAHSPRLRLAAVILAAAATVSCATAAPRAGMAAAREEACARIFSTNDTHGRLLPAAQPFSRGRPVGGSAAMAAYVAQARAETPACPLFVVSGGDIMQGTLISNLTDGASTIAAFNAIGYDVAAIGNHEFDWGVDVLRARIAEAGFAMLGANIYLKGTDRHPEWARPWAIVERDGVRIGFVGMTTRSTPWTTRPANVAGYEFRSIAEALDRYVPEVLAEGVDFVVAVMHEGAFCQDAGTCEGEALAELEKATVRFDYAVTGHTHSRIETTVGDVPVVQSFSNSTAFGLGRLDRDRSGRVHARLLGVRTAWADEIAPDSAVAALVDGYLARVGDRISRVVTELAAGAAKPRRGDFPLGRLIADAQRSATGAQVALMNNGGIRRPLPAGPITYSDLFEVQPFGNRLLRLRVTGDVILRALEHALEEEGTDAQVSGLRVWYDLDAPEGSQILRAELADGTPIAPDSRYSVAVNDFMAQGGSGYGMLVEADETLETGIVDLDALVEYLEGLPRPVELPEEERWIRMESG